MANTSDDKRRLSFLDASFLYGESAVNPTHVGSIFRIEGELSFERVVHHLQQRLHISPRFRQRLVFAPFNLAHPTLEDDPNFDLKNHVHLQQLPFGIDETEAIQEIVRRHFARVMDRTRPLWDFTLYEGLPGISLVVWAMHHAVVDGVSGFEMLNGLMDFTPNPRPEIPPKLPAPPTLPTTTESFVRAAHDLAVEQIDTAVRNTQELMRNPAGTLETLIAASRLLTELAQPAIASPWNAGMAVGTRHLSWLKMALADYRAIRNAFGGTINDIVLTVLGEGAARYLQHHGWPTDGMLRFACPVNVRRPGEEVTLENRISTIMPTTPAAPFDVIERLKLITQQTKHLKQSGAPYIMERMTSLAASIPPAVMGAASTIGAATTELIAGLIRAMNWTAPRGGMGVPAPSMNFVATNVPGPQTAWYFAGHKVTDMLGLLPLGGNLGYGVGITSYDQNIIFSMMSDSRLMPDPEQMKAFVQEAFEELLQRVPMNVVQESVAARRAEAA
ncbi:MAG TPA: wax ester/triacylglycerol synthase family O-acyltransferase [Candidatus Binataceae bacterium]|nr:wax ester/triacylglycerol synthase family O-acyltransferase [Candidatus Binataceae bacterium]